jgi:hypothetical protein
MEATANNKEFLSDAVKPGKSSPLSFVTYILIELE